MSSGLDEEIKNIVSSIDEIKKLGDSLFDSINDAFRVPIDGEEQLEINGLLEKKFKEVDEHLEKSKLKYGIEIDDENTMREIITQVKSGNRKEKQKITNIKNNARLANKLLTSKLRNVIKEDDLENQ